MRFLLKPAVHVLDRLSYPLKFGLIALICALAASVLLAQMMANLRADMRLTEREIVGLELVDAGTGVLLMIQQHRGLSAGVLGGSAELASKLKERAGALGESIARLDALLDADAELASLRPGWGAVRSEVQTLTTGGLGMSAPDNFRAHTAAVERMLTWLGDAGGVSHLSQDPDAGSDNLINPMLNAIPEMTERLGRLRGRGTGILARASAAREDEHVVVAFLAELARTEAVLADRLARAGKANPELDAGLKRAMLDIAAAVGRVREAATREILEQRFQMAPPAFFDLGTAAIDTVVRHLNESIRPAALQLLEARQARLQRGMLLQIALSAVAMLLAGYLFVAIYHAIKRSVQELSAGAQRLAGGDYRSRVSFSARDELAEVAERFNVMADEVAALIREIQQSAAEVGNSATDLSGSARRVSDGSEDQRRSAAAAAQAVEQMTASVDGIARHAAIAQALAETSGHLSAEGGEVMRRSVAEMERIAEAVDTSGEAIRQLGEQSSEISTIVGSIREIADQTNLLALNAAIEAARAGESGRGFAVVADEVRKLAERTARATEEISRMVGAIQTGTVRAVETMQQGVQRVREGVTLTNRAGESMTQISAGAGQVLSAVSEISAALSEQSAASGLIARNVEDIAQMAETNSVAVRDTASTAARLEDLATKLRRQVERFRV